MFVKSIDWIDEENLEADVEISDGKYSIICFACPFNYQEGDVYKDYIQCLNIEYVYTSQENSYYVESIFDYDGVSYVKAATENGALS